MVLPRPTSESNTPEVLELAHFTAENTKPVFMVTEVVLNHWQQLTTASCSFECCCHPYTVKNGRILVPQFCKNEPNKISSIHKHQFFFFLDIYISKQHS